MKHLAERSHNRARPGTDDHPGALIRSAPLSRSAPGHLARSGCAWVACRAGLRPRSRPQALHRLECAAMRRFRGKHQEALGPTRRVLLQDLEDTRAATPLSLAFPSKSAEIR